MDDLKNTNSMSVRAFCDKFETKNSLEKRMKKILRKLASAVLIKDISWEDLFNLFDTESKGYITQEDCKNLTNHLQLNLSNFEIESMIGIIGKKQGSSTIVTLDIFKEKIIDNLQGIRNIVLEKIKQNLLYTLYGKMSKTVETRTKELQDHFKELDVSKAGTATTNNFIGVLSRIGITNLSKTELSTLLEVGNVQNSNEFSYTSVSQALSNAIEKEIVRRTDQAQRQSTMNTNIVEKIYVHVTNKNMSIFDMYCQFDVFLHGAITQVEFASGIKSREIEQSEENIIALWEATLKEFQETQERSEKPGRANRVKLEKMTYHAFLFMFTSRGILQVAGTDSKTITFAVKFIKQIQIAKVSLEALFNAMDVKGKGNVDKKDFISGCKKKKINMSSAELESLYDDIKGKGTDGITYKSFVDFIQANSKNEDKIIRIYTRIHKVSERRKINWSQVFEQEMNGNSEKRKIVDEIKLNSKELSDALRNQRLELKQEEIDMAVNNLNYDRNGAINVKDFEAQLKEWNYKFQKKRDEEVTLLKTFVHKVNNALIKPEATIEIMFGEVDRDKDGAITFEEFWLLLNKLEINLLRKDAVDIFIILSGSVTEKLKVEVLKRKMQGTSYADQYDIIEGVSNDDKEAIFQKIRTKLEEKSTSLQEILTTLKIDPIMHITFRGMKELFYSIEVNMSDEEIKAIDCEIKRMYRQDQYSYQILVDFMVRRRVDTSEKYLGLSDPGVIICLQALSRVLKKNSITPFKAFEIISTHKKIYVNKKEFIHALEGMQMKVSKDDIIALFNSMDKNRSNAVHLDSFLKVLAHATQAEREQTKKSTTGNKHEKVIKVVKSIANVFEKEDYSSKQLFILFDLHGTGILGKEEFIEILRNKFSIGLNDARQLAHHFFKIGHGKISVSNAVKLIEEKMNEDTEGLFSIRQAKPIIKKIKREIDTDPETFIAEILKYEQIIEESTGRSGISKKNLYGVLHSFKAYLSEEEKRIMNTAFELREDNNLLDMQKFMKVIESIPIEPQEKGVQYSLNWERKIYKRIGDYLKKKGKTLADTFNDLSENGYISQQMLASRLKEFQVNLSDNEIDALLSLLTEKGEKPITIKSFIQKFYAAYIINVISLYYYRSILLLLLIYPKMMK